MNWLRALAAQPASTARRLSKARGHLTLISASAEESLAAAGLGLHVSNLRRNVVVRPRSCWTRSGASFLSTTTTLLSFPVYYINITPARRDHEVGPT